MFQSVQTDGMRMQTCLYYGPLQTVMISLSLSSIFILSFSLVRSSAQQGKSVFPQSHTYTRELTEQLAVFVISWCDLFSLLIPTVCASGSLLLGLSFSHCPCSPISFHLLYMHRWGPWTHDVVTARWRQRENCRRRQRPSSDLLLVLLHLVHTHVSHFNKKVSFAWE